MSASVRRVHDTDQLRGIGGRGTPASDGIDDNVQCPRFDRFECVLIRDAGNVDEASEIGQVGVHLQEFVWSSQVNHGTGERASYNSQSI
jgi:hypothetical protein